jgi:enoyl-CoA hydratase
MSEVIQYRKKGHVATITLNRPEALNAITVEMIEELMAVLTAAGGDQEVRALVLTGAGRAFCVGADIRQLQRWREDSRLRERFRVGAAEMFRLLREFRRPVIAALNGTTAAGGFELCCLADIVIAAEEAMVGDGHANYVGFGPMSAVMAARVMPRKLACELMFTGEMWPARKLELAGSINRVVPSDQVMAVATGVAERIAAKPPLALAAAKELMRRMDELEPQALLSEAFRRAEQVFETQDFAEGLRAFEENRPPAFRGV